MARHKEIYQTAEWEKVRQYVVARDNGLCQECLRHGKITAGREVDHITALSNDNKSDWGIAYNPDNLQLLCDSCHQDKHNRSIGLQKFIMPVK
jgi:5-methylcytosine-specific restriction endonuclease McrA